MDDQLGEHTIMDDRINQGEAEFEAFKEWLEETATREGSSPDEVLSQLMSTYWILTELTDVIEETPYADGEVDLPDGDDSTETDHQAIVDVIESIADMNQGQQSPDPQPSSSIDPGIIQLIEALGGRGEGSSQSGPSLSGVAEYRLEKLKDEVGDLEDNLGSVDNRTEEMDNQLTAHSRQLEQLDADVRELEDKIADAADEEDLRALESRVEDRFAELEGQLDETTGRFEDAYASIRQILEYLLAASDQNEEKLEAVIETLEETCADLNHTLTDLEQLTDLKREADRRGITAPVCDSCEHEIDLSLLSEPNCPSCERPIEGFESKSNFLGKSQIATTRAERQHMDEDERLEALHRRLERAEEVEKEMPEQFSLREPE